MPCWQILGSRLEFVHRVHAWQLFLFGGVDELHRMLRRPQFQQDQRKCVRPLLGRLGSIRDWSVELRELRSWKVHRYTGRDELHRMWGGHQRQWHRRYVLSAVCPGPICLRHWVRLLPAV